jgi:IS5 family transposase
MSLWAASCKRKTKRTREHEFHNEMNLEVSWAELVALVTPHAPARDSMGCRPPFPVETILRIHFLQQRFNLSDPAMDEAMCDTPLFREFSGLDMGEEHLPDGGTILRFRHRLEAHSLSVQNLATNTAKCLLLEQHTMVDANFISAPSSTKTQDGECDPEMQRTKKPNLWHSGMRAHADVDADSGLVNSLATIVTNVHDITQAHMLLHAEEHDVFAGSGYRGVKKRNEILAQHPVVNWHIAMMPGKRRRCWTNPHRWAPSSCDWRRSRPVSTLGWNIRFRSLSESRLCHGQVPCAGEKNTANLVTLFELSNLWIVRKRLLNKVLQA